MCDQCDGITRRTVLKVAGGLALTGAMAACQTQQPVVEQELPDAYQDHLIQEQTEDEGGTGAVTIDPRKIVVPPPQPAQKTEYGDIMPRSAWTHVPLELSNGRPMDGVERVTIHHSGDGKPFVGTSVADVARHLQIVQQAHLQRGMIDIAYHFAIDRAGRAWQLRWLKYEGQHVRMSADKKIRWNEHNIGIVMLGDFNLQNPSQQQFDRLCAMVNLVRGKYKNIPASRVSMHGELVQTDCPGRSLRPHIITARKQGLM